MTNISGSTVLLTGASCGVGHALTRALVDKGASLVVTGGRADALELEKTLGDPPSGRVAKNLRRVSGPLAGWCLRVWSAGLAGLLCVRGRPGLVGVMWW
ncbi:hypothetical protein [Streptomyces chartreusis]|uniref:hypothetical protein n=1 Tax=Streptomyces chartreusis TaxID=1969 RepID=UPI003818C74A